MSYWRSVKFWAVFLVLILPSSVMFALPGAMFVEESAFERWAPLILPLQAFVTIAVPYVIARRLVFRGIRSSPGFPVVQTEDPRLKCFGEGRL